MIKQLAQMIDHTILKADATQADIAQLCTEAAEHKFASVCINPAWVKVAAEALANTPEVKVCTVIGFPLGSTTSEVKAFEAEDAVKNGATEVDMVINIGALKSGLHDEAGRDIKAVVDSVKGKSIVKVIIETALLTDEEKIIACKLAVESGADFVKTSTGFSGGGATIEDVALMRDAVGPSIGVKASGGIKSLEDAELMIEAGATRLGTSSGVLIVSE